MLEILSCINIKFLKRTVLTDFLMNILSYIALQ